MASVQPNTDAYDHADIDSDVYPASLWIVKGASLRDRDADTIAIRADVVPAG